jgi:hypothetical protein
MNGKGTLMGNERIPKTSLDPTDEAIIRQITGICQKKTWDLLDGTFLAGCIVPPLLALFRLLLVLIFSAGNFRQDQFGVCCEQKEEGEEPKERQEGNHCRKQCHRWGKLEITRGMPIAKKIL